MVSLRDGKYYLAPGIIREKDLPNVDPEVMFEFPYELEERRILNWKEEDIAYAEDADGNKYDGPEAVAFALTGIKIPKDGHQDTKSNQPWLPGRCGLCKDKHAGIRRSSIW